MAPRTKRVAAVVAQSKIKTIIEKYFITDSDDRRNDCHTKAKRRSSSVFDFDDVVTVDAPHRGTLMSKTKNDHCQNQPRKSLKNKNKEKRMHKSETTRSLKDVLPKSSSNIESNTDNLYELLSSSSCSHSTRNPRRHEFMTTEKDYVDYQRRRSIRSLNSTGPMILSYRTSYRIHIGHYSPECSPILSTRLRFTPVAHIPTTPTHAV